MGLALSADEGEMTTDGENNPSDTEGKQKKKKKKPKRPPKKPNEGMKKKGEEAGGEDAIDPEEEIKKQVGVGSCG